jgi:thymidylate kinase
MTLITVSGLDGAGKSTLVDALRREYEARRRRVTVLHQNDNVGVFAWTRRLRDRLRGHTTPPDAPPRLAPAATRLGRARDAIVWHPWLRRLLVPLDLVIFACVRTWYERIRGDVLLMDRYFYDTFVDLATREGRDGATVLLHFTPRPDLAVLLDVEPEIAWARKGEYSVEYLARRAAAYRELFPRVPSSLQVYADAPDAVRRRVVHALQERSA